MTASPVRASRLAAGVIQLLTLAIFALLLTACAYAEPYVLPADLKSPYTGYTSPRYQSADWWVCRPDMPDSPCKQDRTATELRADGTRAVVKPETLPEPKLDCFYVYPTVNLSLSAYNHDDFTDTRKMAATTFAQAAGFSEACTVYAPLYRQITIGAYLRSAESRERRLAVAFSDVADAFAHYMGQYNRGRPVALVGHSQGAEMVVRLLRRFFDQDPALKERLVVAMPIGGHVEVKKGSATGGSFATLPLCTAPEQTGCVVAYRSYRGADAVSPLGGDAPAAGNEIACVNPADIAGNARRPLSRTMVPLSPAVRDLVGDALHVEDVQTPMLMLRDFYSAQCVDGKDGFRYLAVWPSSAAGDARAAAFDLAGSRFGNPIGLHVLDFQLPQGDLVDLVKKRAAALP